MHQVVWEPSKKTLIFQPSGHFARGLTKTLAAEFMPHYSFRLAINSLPVRKPKKRGQYLGSLADRQLSKWANTGKLPRGRRCKRFEVIRQALTEAELVPIYAQLPVGDEALRVATMVDLVCRDMEGRIVLVELKCGFDDYFHVPNQGHMLAPLQNVEASFRNKAWLQLWLTTEFYHHTAHQFHQYTYASSYLLHVYENNTGVLTYTLTELPAWVKALNLPAIKNHLQSSRHTNKRQRSRILANEQRKAKRRFAMQKEKSSAT